jgi:hypothetical protein
MRGALQRKLRQLGRAVNELTDDTINYGGCCVYAAAVARRLREVGVQKVEVVLPRPYHERVGSVNDARNNLDNANPTVKDWEHAGLSFRHVAVRFKHKGHWYTHDSDTLFQGKRTFGDCHEYTALPDGMTVEEAVACAAEPKGWNSTFHRALIPGVHNLVHTIL